MKVPHTSFQGQHVMCDIASWIDVATRLQSVAEPGRHACSSMGRPMHNALPVMPLPINPPNSLPTAASSASAAVPVLAETEKTPLDSEGTVVGDATCA